MADGILAPTSTGRPFLAVPERYVVQFERRLRSLALDGRGDDARGRHLASLYALEWVYRHGLFEYRPARDPGRWLVLLLDVAGARMGLSPSARLTSPIGEFFARLGQIGLGQVAQRSRAAVFASLARTYGLPTTLTLPLLDRMSAASVLWSLGVPACATEEREKHPQGRQVRKALRARIDGVWSARLVALETARPVGAAVTLGAIPISFAVLASAVQAALVRVGEDLEQVPFAVFYALLTDARRGGRVWRPHDAYVEGGSYDRATFDTTVGHALQAARSRKRRYRRSSALAELGLSATFPATIARLDRWLRVTPPDELRLDRTADGKTGYGWYAWARSEADTIASIHGNLVQAIGSTVRSRSVERHDDFGRR